MISFQLLFVKLRRINDFLPSYTRAKNTPLSQRVPGSHVTRCHATRQGKGSQVDSCTNYQWKWFTVFTICQHRDALLLHCCTNLTFTVGMTVTWTWCWESSSIGQVTMSRSAVDPGRGVSWPPSSQSSSSSDGVSDGGFLTTSWGVLRLFCLMSPLRET